MSISGNVAASIVVASTPNNPSYSAPLQVVENGLVELDETFASTSADQALGIGIANTAGLHYLLIAFSGAGGTFKVVGNGTPNNDAVAVPMEDGGSVQFVSKTTGPATAAQIFLNSIEDTGTDPSTLLKLLITPGAVGLRVRVIAIYDPTP